jgi:hypothetical protein
VNYFLVEARRDTMSDDIPPDAKARALDLVRNVIDHTGVQVSTIKFGDLVDAVEQDLRTMSDDASLAEARLAKVETQACVLSEAVVAITETSQTLAPAVRAVKDEM